MVIGRAYGMLAENAPDAAALRATFFIDPDGIVRAKLCYPATIGRSVDELLRVVAALQMVDSDNGHARRMAPGDDVLLPPYRIERRRSDTDGRCLLVSSDTARQAQKGSQVTTFTDTQLDAIPEASRRRSPMAMRLAHANAAREW